MGIKVRGYGAVKLNLDRTEDRVVKHSIEWLELAGKIVANEARMRAPVDTHDLEKAIKANQDAEISGMNRRKTISVYVDLDALDLEGKHEGFDYATEMHEGVYKLGPKSQLKDSMTDRGVGPKYLERALEDNIERLRRMYEERVRRAIKQ